MRSRLVKLHLQLHSLLIGASLAWVTISNGSRKSHLVTPVPRMKVNEHDRENLKVDLKLLLIDHYDSFTYNLVDLLKSFCVEPPTVVSADKYKSWTEFQQTQSNRYFDGIILSPGPGHPSDKVCTFTRDCVRQNERLPILGVCLGHQILGHVYGATVRRAPEPIHGQIKGVRMLEAALRDDCIWRGISRDQNIDVMRYHSLQVSDVDTTDLIPTVVSNDDDAVLMAMRHSRYPHYGLQFHPESIGTQEIGPRLIRNFVMLCMDSKQGKSSLTENETFPSKIAPLEMDVPVEPQHVCHTTPACPTVSVYVHKVPDLPPNGANLQPMDVMDEILKGEDYVYWLDSSQVGGVTSRTSILGASRRRVEYWGFDKPMKQRGVFVSDGTNAPIKDSHHDILSYLDQHQRNPTHCVTMVSFNDGMALTTHYSEEKADQLLPFQFRGGHVGYLGYEVRHDTLRCLENDAQGELSTLLRDTCEDLGKSNPNVPTAAFLWAEKSFVYDHHTSDWYLVQVLPVNGREAEMFEWMRSTSFLLQQGRGSMAGVLNTARRRGSTTPLPMTVPSFVPTRTRQMYNHNFKDCIQHIRDGESYELCLTNQFEALCRRTGDLSAFDLYTILRQRNPAPFSAFFNWNGNKGRSENLSEDASFALCCSSPERFLSVKQTTNRTCRTSRAQFQVEARPIKGTIARVLPSDGRISLTAPEQEQDTARVDKLQSSVKDRAENLMIVDLLRNDLSRVCETGSVHVSNLTAIESFATVHQMVSTIRGTLNDGANVVDVLKACFPGGSMTGAPKRRTMELLDEMEKGFSRGPYSGCLGYISLNGCMDMNIVIRTAVVTPLDHDNNDSFWKVSIGAGGAITALSDSADEYDEMLLKASAIMSAVQEWTMNAQINPSMVHQVTANQQNVSVSV